MGLAKYYEDNIEIMFDRLYMMGNYQYANEIKFDSSIKTIPFEKESIILYDELKQNKQDSEHKYKDKHIVCRDCGKTFLFSARSQKYFESNGWKSPKRCKSCRDFKNARYLMCASF